MTLHHYFRNLLEGKRRGLDALVLLHLLGILSIPYGAVMRLRKAAYDAGLLRTHRLPKPVVSVGNITVGGTGKTPMTALIARYCLDRGKKVCVISRGYGGSLEGSCRIVSDGRSVLLSAGEAGDEPVLLAKSVPGLMVVIGTDRHAAGLFALERLAADIIILDDGYQHIRLHRDLNVLLLDCERPLDNGNVLPAGLLREPASAVKRADLIIYTRCGKSEPAGHFPCIPSCMAKHELAGVVGPDGGEMEPLSNLSRLRGVAFAGIADPVSFFTMLDESGLDIPARISFPDHCGYGKREIEELLAARESVRGDYLITTEKDMVKLSPHMRKLGCVYAAVLAVKIADMKHLTDKLEKLL